MDESLEYRYFPNFMTCPSCGIDYILGRTGVGDGCDECCGIVRDERGLIVHDQDGDIPE